MEDGGDTTCGCEKCTHAKGDPFWCGDHVEVIGRASSDGRERARGDRASEVTRRGGIVVEKARVGGERLARVVVWAR